MTINTDSSRIQTLPESVLFECVVNFAFMVRLKRCSCRLKLKGMALSFILQVHVPFLPCVGKVLVTVPSKRSAS